MQGPCFIMRKCIYTFHSAYFVANLGTVVINIIEYGIPDVDFVVIFNIPVALDSGCHSNQDRKCHEMYINSDFDHSFPGNNYHKFSKCYIGEIGDTLLIIPLKTVLE